MREIDLVKFADRQRAGAVVIDVREPFEYWMGHVPGAATMPLSRLGEHAGELPRGVPVYVICASGNRSLAAVEQLRRAGVDAWSVAGGTAGWRRAGHPVVRGRRAGA
jgi:rhodanese-related sulfurtransferase